MIPNEVRRAGSTARVFRVPSTSGSRLVLEQGDSRFDLSRGFEHARHGDLQGLIARGFFEHLPELDLAALARRWPATAPAEILTPFAAGHVGKILALTHPPRELFERQAAGECSRWFDNRSPATLAADRAPVHASDAGDSPELGSADLGVWRHELFLAVVISRRACGLDVGDAAKFVAGYMAASDFTRRALDGRPRTPWFGESPAGTLVIGPAFVPSSSFDLEEVSVSAQRLRGERVEPRLVERSSLTGDVALAVASLSRLAILHPGDLVLVPTRVALGVVEHGDEVHVAIEGIGELTTSIHRRARLRQQA